MQPTQSKDDALQTLFHIIAKRTSSETGACRIRNGDVLYLVCGCCVLSKACPKELMTLPNGVSQPLSGTNLPLRHVKSSNVVSPEALLKACFTYEYDTPLFDRTAFFPMADGLAVLQKEEEDNTYTYIRTLDYKQPKLVPSLYVFQFEISSILGLIRYTFADMKGSLGFNSQTSSLVTVLTGDTSLLYMVMPKLRRRSGESLPRIKRDNKWYVLDGWSDERLAYTEIKEDTMPRSAILQNPIEARKKQVEGIEEPTLPAVPSVPAEPVEEVAKPAPVPEAPAEVAAPVAAPVAEAVQEPARPEAERTRKRQRRPAASVGGKDFSDVIEYLSSGVEALPPEDIGSALEEIRAIRDLQIAAARRAANLTLAVHKANYSTVQEMFDKLKKVVDQE